MPHEHHSGDRLNILSVDENFDTTLTCPESIWFHPLLQHKPCADPISKDQLRKFAYDYFLKFLPFFRNQSEGCIGSGVQIEVTRRLKSRLGLAYMFERRINLNENYFASEPALLPYTLFHEMTHLWLYGCLLDPGHTRRFYSKMKEFEKTGLPIDPEVHIHSRVAPESTHIYGCPNCDNRWYMKEVVSYSIYCGHCYDTHGIEYFATLVRRAGAKTVTLSSASVD